MGTVPKVKSWSDPSILKSFKNPRQEHYILKDTNPELTFLGGEKKPDHGTVVIELTPGDKCIELKSLKEYFVDFRDRRISYERIISTVFDDLWKVYEPKHLRITMSFNARGGISSERVVDSIYKKKEFVVALRNGVELTAVTGTTGAKSLGEYLKHFLYGLVDFDLIDELSCERVCIQINDIELQKIRERLFEKCHIGPRPLGHVL